MRKNLKGNVLIKTHPEACREQLNYIFTFILDKHFVICKCLFLHYFNDLVAFVLHKINTNCRRMFVVRNGCPFSKLMISEPQLQNGKKCLKVCLI